MIKMKICSKCGESRPMSEFYHDKNKKDGHQPWCKICAAEYERKYYEANREKKIEYSCEWYKANREKKAEYDREYRKANREKLSAHCREYCEAHREEKAEYDCKYREANREKIAEYKREYDRKRRAEDIQFRLAGNLRARLNNVMKGKAKNGSAVRDLGCSLGDLKQHLESQFAEGMTWDNYGDWHVDHILPLSAFDLTDRKQLLEACHYTNLQPLWAEDNIRKSGKTHYAEE